MAKVSRLSIFTYSKSVVIYLLVSASVVYASENIQISEILPNPANENDEYIELINLGDMPTDLNGFSLDDEPNAGSKPYKISSQTIIVPQEKKRFFKNQTNIALNNSKQKDQDYADIVQLIDKQGSLLDSIKYLSTQTDIPIAHTLPTITPLPPSPTQIISLATPTLTPTAKPQPTYSPSPQPSTSQVLGKEVPIETISTPTPSSITTISNNKPKKHLNIGIIFIILGTLFLATSIIIIKKNYRIND